MQQESVANQSQLNFLATFAAFFATFTVKGFWTAKIAKNEA
jgi:hypothetical protein